MNARAKVVQAEKGIARVFGRLKVIDGITLACALLLAGLGVLTIFSIMGAFLYNARLEDATVHVIRSLTGVIFGIIAMLVIVMIPFKFMKTTVGFFSIFVTVGLLLLTLIMGHGTVESPDVNRWMTLAGITFQPAEFARASMILSLAWLIQVLVHNKKYYTKKLWAPYLLAGGYAVLCGFLVLVQPDLGSGIVMLGIGFTMFLSSGLHRRQISSLLGIGAGLGFLAMVGFLTLDAIGLQAYQMERIQVWRDPFNHERGLQTVMGYVSIALGGPFGAGLGRSMQRLGFAIEPHTDLIITILAEELGLIAVIGVMILYFIIALRCFLTSLKARDVYSALVCIGVGSFFLIQPLVNLGGVGGLIPLSGVTLPLMSYGMTSAIASFIMLGIYFNVRINILEQAKLDKLSAKEQAPKPEEKSKIIPFNNGKAEV